MSARPASKTLISFYSYLSSDIISQSNVVSILTKKQVGDHHETRRDSLSRHSSVAITDELSPEAMPGSNAQSDPSQIKKNRPLAILQPDMPIDVQPCFLRPASLLLATKVLCTTVVL